MVSLVKKSIRGKPYYYARECQRINGRPKIVWQKYLGKADDIVAAMSQANAPAEADSAVITELGAVAALYDLAERLGVAQTIDTAIVDPKLHQTVRSESAVFLPCILPQIRKQHLLPFFFHVAEQRLETPGDAVCAVLAAVWVAEAGAPLEARCVPEIVAQFQNGWIPAISRRR